MGLTERARAATEYRHWLGNMEADYVYTSGVAGEEFFKALRDDGRLLASRCPGCRALDLPPKLYCEECFAESSGYEEVGPVGSVAAFTVLRVGLDGTPLAAPEVRALVRFEGVRGGLVHRVAAGPEQVRAGMRVRAVLKPRQERRGDILDILHFEAAEEARRSPGAAPARPRSRDR